MVSHLLQRTIILNILISFQLFLHLYFFTSFSFTSSEESVSFVKSLRASHFQVSHRKTPHTNIPSNFDPKQDQCLFLW